VESKSDDLVSVLDSENKKNILAKTRKKKNEEESQITTRLVDSLMNQVEQEYKLFMKKVVVLREMQEGPNAEKFKALRIKMRFIKNEIPFFGTIARFDFPKKDFMEIVRRSLLHPIKIFSFLIHSLPNSTFHRKSLWWIL